MSKNTKNKKSRKSPRDENVTTKKSHPFIVFVAVAFIIHIAGIFTVHSIVADNKKIAAKENPVMKMKVEKAEKKKEEKIVEKKKTEPKKKIVQQMKKEQAPKQVAKKKTVRKEAKATQTRKQASAHKPKSVKTRTASRTRKVVPPTTATARRSLGRTYHAKVKDGSFPQLNVSYPDPVEWAKFLQRLGALTLVYDTTSNTIYSADLFSGQLQPQPSSILGSVGMLKHLIEDQVWNSRRQEFARRIGTSHVEIFALLPLGVEQEWTGHQVAVIRKLGLNVGKVMAVDARVADDGKFRVLAVHTKNGRTLQVDDRGGA